MTQFIIQITSTTKGYKTYLVSYSANTLALSKNPCLAKKYSKKGTALNTLNKVLADVKNITGDIIEL